ncbi:MAG: hypothetical protein ACLQVL_24115 [Terriglobia bacterium]
METQVAAQLGSDSVAALIQVCDNRGAVVGYTVGLFRVGATFYSL